MAEPEGTGSADLVVSDKAHKFFTEKFDAFRDVFEQQRKAIKDFEELPNVLMYTSALDTHRQLNVDAPKKVIDTLDDYLDYLDDFKKSFDAAIRRIQSDDQA